MEDRSNSKPIYTTQVTDLEKDVQDVVKNHMGANTNMVLTFNESSELTGEGIEVYSWISSFIYLSQFHYNQYELRVLTVGMKNI